MVGVDVVVVGAGQAGLALGYCLRNTGLSVVLLEAADRVAASWDSRWDSLRLFTPACFSSLPGLEFPADPYHHPSKDEVASYLRLYADHFGLPIYLNSEVTRVELQTQGQGFTVTTPTEIYRARHVVVATGPFQQPIRPTFATKLDPQVRQLHSHEYRNPAQVNTEGVTVVVGAGNSGAQISAELAAAGHDVVVSGRLPPYLPQHIAGKDLFWWLHHLTLLQAPTQSLRGRLLRRRGDPVIGTNLTSLTRQRQLCLISPTIDAHDTHLTFEDGTRLEPATIIWATGYRHHYPWLQPSTTTPPQDISLPGLHFLGLSWQHSRGSALLAGIGHDATTLAHHITKTTPPT